MRKMLLLLSLLLTQSQAIFPQTDKEKIQALMLKARIPGLSLAYIKNGKVDKVYNLGVRSIDTKAIVDDETVFSAASLSKCVFAYGVMHLVEEGKLDLDLPLYNYFEYGDLQHDSRYKKITARQVLSHTSGLPNWRNNDSLNFRYNPGERFSYSGEGFVLLTKVVEKITGQRLEDLMQQTVFKPLGMMHTSYVWQASFNNDYAFPHTDIMKTNAKFFPKEPNAASSLQTTAADYAKFVVALLNHKGLKPATFQNMFKPQPNSQVEKNNNQLYWGLGLGYQETTDGPSFWQWGDNGTFKAFLIGYPNKKEGLVYFADSYGGLTIADDILHLFFDNVQPAVKWVNEGQANLQDLELLNRLVAMPFNDAMQPFLMNGTKHQDTTLVPELKMNKLGFRLLQLKQIATAQQIFEMNLVAYPQSAKAYKGLGETHMRAGYREVAAQAFLKSYELDPGDRDAKTIANRLAGVQENEDKKNEKSVTTTFRLGDYNNAKYVALAGAFNGWNGLTIPMRWENGAWIVEVNLQPGTYQYNFVVDGVWVPDPGNPVIKTDGTLHSTITVEKK